MKYALLLTFTLFLSIAVSGQSKIVFKQGIKRTKIKTGKTIGVTLQGDTFAYDNWESVCSYCGDSICGKNIWTLDSILENYIVVKRLIDDDSAFIFDTITYRDKIKYREYSKNWNLVEEIQSPDSNILNNSLVYRYPVFYTRKTVSLDSIYSFSFSRSNDCIGYSLSVPLGVAMLIIGSPIIAIDNGSFDIGLFVIGETLGLFVTYLLYRDLQNRMVETYSKDKWSFKAI